MERALRERALKSMKEKARREQQRVSDSDSD